MADQRGRVPAHVRAGTRPRPHDLLRIADPAMVIPLCDRLRDHRVRRVLARIPWVVVRRDSTPTGILPVGVRGDDRSERWPALAPASAIIQLLTPYDLLTHTAPRDLPVFRAIDGLTRIPRPSWVRAWGPGGSAGFELATAAPAATAGSDLDLVVDTPDPVPPTEATRLLRLLADLPVRVDVQLQTPYGGVACAEYARGQGPVLLRTDHGPLLVTDPWTAPQPVSPALPEDTPR